MSNMNFLEKLLDGVAVEWKALGELGEFVRGSGLQKSDFTDSGIGCIHYGQIYTFYGDYAYQTKSFVSSTLATKLRKAQKSDLIIATTSENIEDVCKTLVWLGEEEVCVSGETYIFKHNQNPKYLAYYLKMPSFFDFKKRNRTGTKVIRVHGDRLATFQIPIPCPDNPEKSLAIQAEIVQILDTFTALTAELTAELTDRKKQYNYYRDRLLTFEKGEVEWKTLGEVYKFQYGMGNTIPTLGGEYPVYGSNGIVGTHNEFNSEDSPVIGHIGAYAGIVNWGAGKHFVTYNGVICKLINKLVHPKYAYYQLLKQDFNSMAKSASHPFVSYDALNKVSVPIPPPAEQARIVAILDKFDTLTHSIREGLPREIALRQKQYEYYRDLLLSFPPPLTPP
jgi:type I restriction enzyme S subunit